MRHLQGRRFVVSPFPLLAMTALFFCYRKQK